jgi:2-oxoglutarate ferredoxin oxidoreductase subunit alpha
MPEDDLVPPMPSAGEGYRIHVTGLTHDERGYPVITAEAHEPLVKRLVDKVRLNAHLIIDFEEFHIQDASVALVSYGCSARVAREAVEMARKRGIAAGLLRLKTIWPFPSKRVRELAPQVKAFIVPEINCGQIAREVQRCALGKPVAHVGLMGGRILTPQEIFDAIAKASS